MSEHLHLVRRRVIVTGRVQGVFFRVSTREQARMRGVAGWVQNRADGAVEAEFEGTRETVESMLEWIRRGGPAGAQVDHVEIHDQVPVESSGFVLR